MLIWNKEGINDADVSKDNRAGQVIQICFITVASIRYKDIHITFKKWRGKRHHTDPSVKCLFKMMFMHRKRTLEN